MWLPLAPGHVGAPLWLLLLANDTAGQCCQYVPYFRHNLLLIRPMRPTRPNATDAADAPSRVTNKRDLMMTQPGCVRQS